MWDLLDFQDWLANPVLQEKDYLDLLDYRDLLESLVLMVSYNSAEKNKFFLQNNLYHLTKKSIGQDNKTTMAVYAVSSPVHATLTP